MKNFIKTNKHRIIALICLVICVLSICSCASCDRCAKDWLSETSGGLHRTIRVYNFDGDLVTEYTGKFDVETDNETYILWDDEMGKRHIIYFSTFNIIIDEN